MVSDELLMSEIDPSGVCSLTGKANSVCFLVENLVEEEKMDVDCT